MCINLTPRDLRGTKLEATKGMGDRRIHARGTIVERMIENNNYWGPVR